MPAWRLLRSPAAPGVHNMAVDEALMAHARQAGEWVFRVYGWSEPTLSFGRNQATRGYDRGRIAEAGLGVVRRPTGGRSILHFRELTYSVVAPCDDAGDLHTSYEFINTILLAGLRSLGVAAQTATAARSVAPGESPCFALPAPGELEVAGRKLVGSAQWRQDGALLQHGSILIEDDQTSVMALLRDADAPLTPPATLADALGSPPSIDDVTDALFGAVRATGRARDMQLNESLQRGVEQLSVRYASDEWTWRR